MLQITVQFTRCDYITYGINKGRSKQYVGML